MPENGKNGKSGWIRWLVAVLFTVLFSAFTTLTGYVIANDQDSRGRDTRQKEELVHICRVQSTVNQQILISLARIETDMVYIKQKVCP